MSKKFVPKPTVMPVDRSDWAKQLGLSNFINAFYQFNDLQLFNDCRKVLVIGLGQGLERIVLKWRGYEVTTLDIDETFQPDYVGSVHDLQMFKDGQFDAVIASHILEHLAVPYLDFALGEIARVGRNAIIYLPSAMAFHNRFPGY
ncbi:MAG: methyltransferase domain-containing protein [Methanosarcinaceae archaeon]